METRPVRAAQPWGANKTPLRTRFAEAVPRRPRRAWQTRQLSAIKGCLRVDVCRRTWQYFLHPGTDPTCIRLALWGRSSVGRALEWHSRGREFDSHRLHFSPPNTSPSSHAAVSCGLPYPFRCYGEVLKYASMNEDNPASPTFLLPFLTSDTCSCNEEGRKGAGEGNN